jgi:two-component system sensor histidine kinase TctE
MARSLRSLLMRRLLWPMLAVTLAGGGLSYYVARSFAEETYDQWLLDTALSLARQVVFDKRGVHVDLPPPALNLLVWDAQDQIYFRVDSQRDGLLVGDAVLAPVFRRDSTVEQFLDGQVQGRPIRSVTIGVPGSDPAVWVTVAETLNKRTRLAGEILVAVVLPQIMLITLAVLLIRSGVRRGLLPIADLEQAVHERRPGDLTPLPERAVPSELMPFTEAINGLLERLGKAIEAQNRFIANAAHQTRTPLAALKVQIERALREPDPETHVASLHQALAALDRTTRLSNQLLLLARAESRMLPAAQLARVDLRAIVFESGAAWVPKALAQGADLGFDDPAMVVPVQGDAGLLAEVVNNLVDNALRYAGHACRITLGVLPAAPGRGPLLQVEDNGPGIPEREREAVFERFYRVPGSAGSSSGLGLSIVREIAHLHGAEVKLEQPESGGVRVRLMFPAAAPGSDRVPDSAVH